MADDQAQNSEAEEKTKTQALMKSIPNIAYYKAKRYQIKSPPKYLNITRLFFIYGTRRQIK